MSKEKEISKKLYLELDSRLCKIEKLVSKVYSENKNNNNVLAISCLISEAIQHLRYHR